MKTNKVVAGILLLTMLTGCATSRSSFYADPVAVGNAEICRTLAGDEARLDPDFQDALRSELRMRGVNEADCNAIVDNQNLAIGAGVLVGAAIVAAAASSKGEDYGHHHHGRGSRETYIDISIDVPPAPPAPPVPAEAADWDQYANASGALVWGCRGVQSRQLFDPARCTGRDMVDERWPSKTF
jgi:hypothetical protein